MHKHCRHYALMSLAYALASALTVAFGGLLEAVPAVIVSLAYWHMAVAVGE
jgi:hypothetical protein